MYVLIKSVGDNGLSYKITARENIIGIDYTQIPIERNLIVGDFYRYKLQLSFNPSRYMTYKYSIMLIALGADLFTKEVIMIAQFWY